MNYTHTLTGPAEAVCFLPDSGSAGSGRPAAADAALSRPPAESAGTAPPQAAHLHTHTHTPCIGQRTTKPQLQFTCHSLTLSEEYAK